MTGFNSRYFSYSGEIDSLKTVLMFAQKKSEKISQLCFINLVCYVYMFIYMLFTTDGFLEVAIESWP